MGMRGGLSSAGGYDEARELGLTIVPWDELAQLGSGVVSRRSRTPAGKALLTFDMRLRRSGLRAGHQRARVRRTTRLRHWPCCEPAAGWTSPPPTWSAWCPSAIPAR